MLRGLDARQHVVALNEAAVLTLWAALAGRDIRLGIAELIQVLLHSFVLDPSSCMKPSTHLYIPYLFEHNKCGRDHTTPLANS